MSRIVRSSKYRHVFGTGAKREDCYDNLKPSKSAWDSDKVCANNKFIGLIWEARGGGSFTVIKNETRGKFSAEIPLINGHAGNVLDIATSVFNDHLFASVSEDGYGKIWNIPEGGLTEGITEPVQNLVGHRRKVGTVAFNPVASNVLVTSSTDYTVKVWDIETGQAQNDVPGHADIIQSVAWNYNGSEIATSSKDKKIRIIDPRSNNINEMDGHPGVKGSRVIYLGEKGWLFNVGFSRSSDRCYSIIDPRNPGQPLAKANIDTSSGMLMPFYDNDTCMLYLAGKGDGNVRYFELTDDSPYIHFLSEYKTSTPQLGMCMRPKTSCDVGICEIANLLKVTNTMIEPVSFQVPRKSMTMFQDDIFPDTPGAEAALTASQWFSGQNASPIKISLEGGFVPREAQEVSFEVVEQEKELSGAELKEEFENLKKRVAYLEAELVKKDAKIKELGGN